MFDSDASRCTPENTPRLTDNDDFLDITSNFGADFCLFDPQGCATGDPPEDPPLFQFTDQVNDVRSVPEPPTWAVMLTGLLSLSGYRALRNAFKAGWRA
jgi:hypothetical protein